MEDLNMSCDDFNLDDMPEFLRDLISDDPTPEVINFVKGYMKYMPPPQPEIEHFRPAVLATPLLEVFSVTIHGSNNHLYAAPTPVEIYGTIIVTNGHHQSFDIYRRDRDKPQLVELTDRNLLSLSGPDSAIEPITDVTIIVDLKDRARDDAVVAQGQFFLDYSKRDYGEHQVLPFHGSNQTYANLHYVIFPYAVIARVQVSFFLNDDDKVGDQDEHPITFYVYGTLVARICSNIGKDDFPSTLLLDKQKHQSVTFSLGTGIQLSRSVLVVPAYASLQLQANLIDHGTDIPIVMRTVEFAADDWGCERKDFPWKNGFIRVQVKWDSAYPQPYTGREPKRSAEEVVSTESRESKIEYQLVDMENRTTEGASSQGGDDHEQEKKRRLGFCDPLPSSSICGIPPLFMKKEKEKEKEKETCQLPTELGQVFSVLINNKESKAFEVNGTIEIDDRGNTIKIFNRDLHHAQICSLPGRLKSLVGPSHFLVCSNGLYMRFELKDRDSRVARGSIVWTYDRLYEPKSWLDRRLCSVFRGDIGYAVLHYSIFNNGVAAEVSVCVGCNDSSDPSCAMVSGRVIASYSRCSYSTRYEKKFYRTVLFDEDQPRSYDGKSLLNELLPVPRNNDLIVKVKLVVSGEIMKDTLEFKIDNPYIKEIKAQKYHIKVGVPRWTTFLSWQ